MRTILRQGFTARDEITTPGPRKSVCGDLGCALFIQALTADDERLLIEVDVADRGVWVNGRWPRSSPKRPVRTTPGLGRDDSSQWHSACSNSTVSLVVVRQPIIEARWATAYRLRRLAMPPFVLCKIRQVVAGTAIVIVLTGTAACDGGDASSTSSPRAKLTGTKKPVGGHSSTATGPRTTLKGIDFCKTLSAESLTAIGVQPSDAKQHNESGRNSDSRCQWQRDETLVGTYAINNWTTDMSTGDRTIEISGFPGIAANAIGNSCDVSMQINDDELEVNVQNFDSSNQALEGKACDVATGFARQILVGITKK